MLLYIHSPQLTSALLRYHNYPRTLTVQVNKQNVVSFAGFLPSIQRTFELRDYIQDWRFTMARLGTRYGVNFVNIRIAPDNREKVLQWILDNEADLGEMLVNLIGDNYKLSLNEDTANDCFIVAITGSDENRVNRGLCMTTRSNDLMECLFMALYKHYVMCDGKSWGEPVDKSTDWG